MNVDKFYLLAIIGLLPQTASSREAKLLAVSNWQLAYSQENS